MITPSAFERPNSWPQTKNAYRDRPRQLSIPEHDGKTEEPDRHKQVILTGLYWLGLAIAIWFALSTSPQTSKHLVPFELDPSLCDAPVTPWIIEHCSSRKVHPVRQEILGPTPIYDVIQAVTNDPTNIYIADNLLKSLRHALTTFPKEDKPSPEVFNHLSELKTTISTYKSEFNRTLKSVSQVTSETIPMLEAQIESDQQASMWDKLMSRKEESDVLWFVDNVVKVDWYWDNHISSLFRATSLMVKQWTVIEKELDSFRKKLLEEDTQKSSLIVQALEAISQLIKQANSDVSASYSRLQFARMEWDSPQKRRGWDLTGRSKVLKHLLAQFRRCQEDAEIAKRDLSDHLARQTIVDLQQEKAKPKSEPEKNRKGRSLWSTALGRSLAGMCILLKMSGPWSSLVQCGAFFKMDDLIFWLSWVFKGSEESTE